MMDMSAADAILKEDYLGPLRSQLNVATPVLSRLEKNEKDIAGREAIIPIEVGLNQGAGARLEDAQLPAAGQGTYKDAKVALKHYYGALQCSGPAMRQTQKGDKGSFGRLVDLEAKGLKKVLSLVLAHDFYMGHLLAKCGVTTAANVVVLDAAANMEYFFVGMAVDIITIATGAVLTANRSITAVDKVNKTVTINGAAVTTAATDGLVRQGTSGACVTSLEDIVDDTADIYGLDTSAIGDAWQSYVAAASGAFTLAKMQLAVDSIVNKSGKYPTVIIGDHARQRKYWGLLTATTQYVPVKPNVLDGGFRSLEYSAAGAPIEWLADRLAPAGTLYILHEPDLQVFSPADFEFIEIGGAVWLPDIMGSTPKDNFKATLFRDMELGALSRVSHGKMTGVTDS